MTTINGNNDNDDEGPLKKKRNRYKVLRKRDNGQ